MNIHKLHKAGLQVDMLGQPLYVGDTVLCKGYYSADKNIFATITKVNKKTVGLNLEISRWSYGTFTPSPPGHTGPWDYYPDSKTTTTLEYKKRPGIETLKLPVGFKQNAQQAAQDFADQYPELLV